VAFQLQNERQGREDRVIRRSCVAAVLTLTLFSLLLAGLRQAPRTVMVPAPDASSIEAPHRAVDSAPPLDVFGNEVSDAVARYKLDASGAPYEEHFPQTELPRLGSPKS
jgi:hypothetical protein